MAVADAPSNTPRIGLRTRWPSRAFRVSPPTAWISPLKPCSPNRKRTIADNAVRRKLKFDVATPPITHPLCCGDIAPRPVVGPLRSRRSGPIVLKLAIAQRVPQAHEAWQWEVEPCAANPNRHPGIFHLAFTAALLAEITSVEQLVLDRLHRRLQRAACLIHAMSARLKIAA